MRLRSSLMSDTSWEQKFREVYDRGVAAWRAGWRTPTNMFSTEDVKFLASIGCTAQELFDFVDDAERDGEPDFATVLAVQAIRRDYYLNEMDRRSSGSVAAMADLPPKTAEVDGIAWLPRIIAKARLKLRGEMPADLMYGCGGDRPFLRQMKLTLPGFLQLVREAGSDDQRIIEAVKKSGGLA